MDVASQRSGPSRSRWAAVGVLGGAALTIAGAWVFQYGFGYVPCALCLMQRQPYYAGMIVALAAIVLPVPARRLALAVLAALFLVSAGLGIYHAGVEWGFWLGPADCGGGAAPAGPDVGDLLSRLNGLKIVSCTEAAWRFLGLSLAGWNVLVSLGLAGLAVRGAARRD
jgi:disulfide bond formation protein DsbB